MPKIWNPKFLKARIFCRPKKLSVIKIMNEVKGITYPSNSVQVVFGQGSWISQSQRYTLHQKQPVSWKSISLLSFCPTRVWHTFLENTDLGLEKREAKFWISRAWNNWIWIGGYEPLFFTLAFSHEIDLLNLKTLWKLNVVQIFYLRPICPWQKVE